MFNKEIARNVLAVIKGLKEKGVPQIKKYESGEWTAKELVLFVSDWLFDHEFEQMKKKLEQDFMSDEQINKTASILQSKLKKG